jgi:hypothetical protein
VQRPIGDEFGVVGVALPFRDASLHADRREAVWGDAERQRTLVIVTPPDRQRAAGGDFFDKPVAHELAGGLLGGAVASRCSLRLG